jgi:prolyl oligopeptidase
VLEKEPVYAEVRGKVLEVLNSKEKIPGISKVGKFLYNFWRDEGHPRGVWRRTTMAEYRKQAPAWETVIDLDALAAGEKENWVWGGADVLEVAGGEPVRALVQLSRGGGDAEVVREFDLEKKGFVEGGFFLPEAKSRVAWGDEDTLLVGTDFGPGSLTTSGYPRVIKEWKRGTPLAAAKTVFEGEVTDMSAGVAGYLDHGVRRVMLSRAVTFFTGQDFLRQGDRWVKFEKPDDADVSTFGDKVLVRLRTDWEVGGKTYKGGSLLATGLEAFLKGEREFAVLFEPTARTALAGMSSTKRFLILNTLDNVASRTLIVEGGGRWMTQEMATVPLATVSVRGLDAEESDEVLVETTGYLTPSTLALGDAARPDAKPEVLKQLPAFFDATGLEVKQFEAVSKDGTKVPYFQVGRKGMALDGSNPTLLYG